MQKFTYPKNRPFVEGLARDLGCGCPDEVFEDIRVFPAPEPIFWSVVIGQKLVLCLMEAQQAAQAPELLRALRLERDRLGLNRVRLVLVGDAAQARIEAGIAACEDERMHVHALLPAQLNS